MGAMHLRGQPVPPVASHRHRLYRQPNSRAVLSRATKTDRVPTHLSLGSSCCRGGMPKFVMTWLPRSAHCPTFSSTCDLVRPQLGSNGDAQMKSAHQQEEDEGVHRFAGVHPADGKLICQGCSRGARMRTNQLRGVCQRRSSSGG